jgi:hypothetical protein
MESKELQAPDPAFTEIEDGSDKKSSEFLQTEREGSQTESTFVVLFHLATEKEDSQTEFTFVVLST